MHSHAERGNEGSDGSPTGRRAFRLVDYGSSRPEHTETSCAPLTDTRATFCSHALRGNTMGDRSAVIRRLGPRSKQWRAQPILLLGRGRS
jgi:hypothetical protein